MGATTTTGMLRVSYYNAKGQLFEEDINAMEFVKDRRIFDESGEDIVYSVIKGPPSMTH